MSTTDNSDATQMIHHLVRERRVSPADGARLIEVRRDLQHRRNRSDLLRKHPMVGLVMLFGVIILGIFGFRRSEA
jgi:hypothetical protein